VEATPGQLEAVKNAVHAMVYIAQLVEVRDLLLFGNLLLQRFILASSSARHLLWALDGFG